MTKFVMVLRVALRAVTVNKMRSVLTMLGIVIGVGAVIALVAAGEGAQAQIVSQFESLGSNLLTVTAGGGGFNFSVRGMQQNTQALTNRDAEAIKGLATSISAVAPEYNANGTAVFMGNSTSPSISGVTPEYAAVRNYQVVQGRFITAEDNTNGAMVVVLGQTVVEDLFGNTVVNPVSDRAILYQA